MSKPDDRDSVILRELIDKERSDAFGSYAQGHLAGMIDALAVIIEPPDGYPGLAAPEPRPAEPSCATCARIGACFKDADWCPNYLAVSAPEPRPAEEPVPAPSEEDDGGLLRDAIATIDKQRAEIIALRSQLARKDEEAELYRRQYDELSAWWRGERPDEEYVGNGHPLEERHARERAALREPAPVASHDASDTIRNARSVSHDNREPDGRKGE